MNGILRSAAIAASLALPAAANAQTAGDELSRLFARTEAQHRSSRRNLTEILRNQPRFWVELQAVAERLQTQPAWLLNVMASESLFNPAARNSLPGQTASGLLQFIEATARRLGTTTDAIRRTNPVEQLCLVERYLTPFRGRLNSLADVYLAVFRGVVIGGRDGVVVVDSGREPRIYALNKSLDLNGDGRIVKGELGLAALSVGRFLPATTQAMSVKIGKDNPPVKKNQQPTRSTRSIYIRPANTQ
ncbi:MAG: transglycosylase SLT domain-containing protein [Blastocatellia bacterium]